jgi:hypothetical protein
MTENSGRDSTVSLNPNDAFFRPNGGSTRYTEEMLRHCQHGIDAARERVREMARKKSPPTRSLSYFLAGKSQVATNRRWLILSITPEVFEKADH